MAILETIAQTEDFHVRRMSGYSDEKMRHYVSNVSGLCYKCNKTFKTQALFCKYDWQKHWDEECSANVRSVVEIKEELSPYVRLFHGNDWGVDFMMLKEDLEHGCCSLKHEIKIPEGTVIHVMWCGKLEECETFNQKSSDRVVGDHGHDTYVPGRDLPYVFVGKRPRLLSDLDVLRVDIQKFIDKAQHLEKS